MGELALHPDNVIQLWTRNGDCEIQLLSGDITRLPVAQKMDILMVSAFPGTCTIFNSCHVEYTCIYSSQFSQWPFYTDFTVLIFVCLI